MKGERLPASTEDERAFLQERIILFASTTSFLCGTALALVAMLYPISPESFPPRIHIVVVFLVPGLVALASPRFFARRRKLSFTALRAMEIVIMAITGLTLAGTSIFMLELPSHVTLTFAVCVIIVFARVFIVPSSPARTFWLVILCGVPVSIANLIAVSRRPDMLGMPVAGYAGGSLAVSVTLLALLTFGSKVIYGLRREVREAKYGQYTIEAKIGEGGMGVVYRARHALLRRPTALKLLPPEKASHADVARFEREVQLASQLTHPNTIAIYDYGRSADGVFYYAMEYVDGINLEHLVAQFGALPVQRALPILVQICESLHEAHARGIVHRDVKPANVVVSRRGELLDFVKVVDFGLVRGTIDDDISVEGEIAGTPAYLSPEAIENPKTIGPASDLYAVGAVAYFLLTGTTVFVGKTIELCWQHMSAQPIPPSVRGQRELPPGLDTLILRCLAKKPKDRPGSARALASEFRAIVASDWCEDDALAFWNRFQTVSETMLATQPTEVMTIRPSGRVDA